MVVAERWVSGNYRARLNRRLAKLVAGNEENSEITEFLKLGLSLIGDVVQYRKNNEDHSLSLIPNPPKDGLWDSP